MPWCSRSARAAGLSLGSEDAASRACRPESRIFRYDKVKLQARVGNFRALWSRLALAPTAEEWVFFRRRDESCRTEGAWVRADEADSPADEIRFD